MSIFIGKPNLKTQVNITNTKSHWEFMLNPAKEGEIPEEYRETVRKFLDHVNNLDVTLQYYHRPDVALKPYTGFWQMESPVIDDLRFDWSLTYGCVNDMEIRQSFEAYDVHDTTRLVLTVFVIAKKTYKRK